MNFRTPQDVYTENYYYTQVFTDIPFGNNGWSTKTYITITFAPTPDTAKVAINKWLDSLHVTGKRDIHLYHKNYKREAKKHISEGNYITY